MIPPLDDFLPYIQREGEPERIKVREVNPAYDAAVEKLVDTMARIRRNIFSNQNAGEDISMEVVAYATAIDEALAAWERVNEGKP